MPDRSLVILLTACIDPGGMALTALTDVDERRRQYTEALRFYLDSTELPVVFTENSGCDISTPFAKDIAEGRLEMFTFAGNKDKTKGKGYGEAEIIEYALAHSKAIAQCRHIIKITGRLTVRNIADIIKQQQHSHNDHVSCVFHTDFSFADSRIFVASPALLHDFLTRREQMNDGAGVYFEHILANTIKESDCSFLPFSHYPLIEGCSGSNGAKYSDQPFSKARGLDYRIFTTSMALRFNRQYRKRKTSVIEQCRLWCRYAILRAQRLFVSIR